MLRPKFTLVALAAAAVGTTLAGCASPEPPPTPLVCADLGDADLGDGALGAWSRPDTRIDSVEEIAESAEGPAHCKVAGTIGSEVHFELLLPTHESWNGRFVMGGGGGFVGEVQNSAMEPMVGGNALERGFATVGTDTGHQAPGIDASWALDNQEREINFAYQAVHDTTEVAKAIIGDYYAGEIAHSYFIGCSRGGGQALIEAQRFPDDYDGIVAMAPAYSWARIGADFVQNQQKMYPDPGDLSSPVVTAANRALLQREILAACDAADGLEDGLLADPRRCDFDPAQLLCRGASGDNCLSGQQLAAVQEIYSGPVIDGEQVFPGYPLGGENDRGGWDLWITGAANALGPGTPNLHFAFGTQMYKYLVFDDPEFDYSQYDFDGWAQDVAEMDGWLSAAVPDLGALRDRGSKLLLWHGWSDPALSALATIQYYEQVEAGDPGVRDYARLFLAPGVLHCSGGPGADQADLLGAVQDWVENGRAPQQVLAQKIDAQGQELMSRPLCPYPQVAVYDGSGDGALAASFRCE